jgi:hypothetical protein
MAHTITTLAPVPASGPGALAGFEWTCTCGSVGGSSLESLARHDGAAHVRYYTKKEGV